VSKVGLGVSAATSWRSAPGPMGHGVRHGGGLRFYGAPWFYENKVATLAAVVESPLNALAIR